MMIFKDAITSRVVARDLMSLIGLAIFAAVYYGSLYNYGYDWGDIGSYAQICYEVSLGSPPTNFFGYGAGWYLLGAGLFHMVGVNFTALMVMVYGLIFASACSLFLAVRWCTERLWPALAVTVVMIVVPPFAASAVRSICLGLFLLPVVMLARTPVDRGWGALAATALAIGLVAAVRPDFGYLFFAILLVVVAARSWLARPTAGGACRRFALSVGVLLLVLAAAFLPLAWFAMTHGFLSALTGNYAKYYQTFYNLIAASAGTVLTSHSSELLGIPPLAALWTGGLDSRIFAILVYSTTAGLMLFGLYTVVRWCRPPVDCDIEDPINVTNGAILLVVGSQWPVFALFRSDWSHFVTFMHAYLVLAAVVVAALVRSDRLPWLVKAPVVGVIGVQILLFVVQGVQAPGMGWLAQRHGRDDVFDGPAGINVKVSTGERMEYEAITQLIQANSKPGDAIVCVPYCPGFAFMAQRRMFFEEHYVDDGLAMRDHDWVNNAIIQTERAWPPVIIVQDWAPNGTEASRFVHWAAHYMDFVRQAYPVTIRLQDATVWLRQPPSTPPSIATVQGYGPTSAVVDTPFNAQPDGSSALWMRVPGARATAAIQFDGKPLATMVGADAITALVPRALLGEVGHHYLQVVDPAFNVSTAPVPFEVVPRP